MISSETWVVFPSASISPHPRCCMTDCWLWTDTHTFFSIWWRVSRSKKEKRLFSLIIMDTVNGLTIKKFTILIAVSVIIFVLLGKSFFSGVNPYFGYSKMCLCVSCSQMSMDNRKRPAGSSNSGSFAFWSSSFRRQPARVLIVEALPPWWSETSPVLCDALDNFFSLACNLDGPCRIPLLSLYAISRQQECLLPFVVRLIEVQVE